MGIKCVQCIRTVTVPSMRGCSSLSVVDPGSEEGGAQGFGGLPPRFLGYILANFKEFDGNRWGGGVSAVTAYPLFYQSMCKPWP